MEDPIKILCQWQMTFSFSVPNVLAQTTELNNVQQSHKHKLTCTIYSSIDFIRAINVSF